MIGSADETPNCKAKSRNHHRQQYDFPYHVSLLSYRIAFV
jgi:hypothetical protein